VQRVGDYRIIEQNNTQYLIAHRQTDDGKMNADCDLRATDRRHSGGIAVNTIFIIELWLMVIGFYSCYWFTL